MRLLLIGHGRMGTLVEALAPEYGCEVCGVLDDTSNERGAGLTAGRWPGVEVAIDFSVGSAVEDNVRGLAALGINIVIGTTGWDVALPRVRDTVERSGIGVVAAPNFSMGAILFGEIAKAASRLLAPHADYGAYVHELHHATKRDRSTWRLPAPAPSRARTPLASMAPRRQSRLHTPCATAARSRAARSWRLSG